MANLIKIIILAFLVVACSQGRHRASDVRYFEHSVEYQGETLGLIARWYTGKADNWKILLDHNPDIDVRRMRPGTFVRIPEALMVREDLMPRSYVERALSERKSETGHEAARDSVGEVSASEQAPQDVVREAPEQVAPPEKTLPEAGGSVDAVAAGTESQAAPAAGSKSRDELLNELLANE